MKSERQDWTIVFGDDNFGVSVLDVYSAADGISKGVLVVTTAHMSGHYSMGVTSSFLPGVTTADLLIDRDRAEVLRLVAKLREMVGPRTSPSYEVIYKLYRDAIDHLLTERWVELIDLLQPYRDRDWPEIENVIELATRRQNVIELATRRQKENP